MKHLQRYLIAGLLVWLPLWITLLIIGFVIDLMDKSLSLLPVAYRPETLLGVNIPGFGLLLSLVILIATGLLVTNFMGRRLVMIWEAFLSRIPLVRTIYSGVKQVVDTLFTPGGQSFRKVLLVEYPRQGLWSVAFQTGNGATQINSALEEELVTIFIPTTPNPTSGFLMLIPKKDVKELDMSVDEALKFVISLGVLQATKKIELPPEVTSAPAKP